MGFPLNIIISIIMTSFISYIIYRIYGKQHFIFKYMVGIGILYILFLLSFSLFPTMAQNETGLNIVRNGIMAFYFFIFVPFFGTVLYFLVKKIFYTNWKPKGAGYLILIVTTFFTIVVFIIGLYVFVYSFYGFAP